MWCSHAVYVQNRYSRVLFCLLALARSRRHYMLTPQERQQRKKYHCNAALKIVICGKFCICQHRSSMPNSSRIILVHISVCVCMWISDSLHALWLVRCWITFISLFFIKQNEGFCTVYTQLRTHTHISKNFNDMIWMTRELKVHIGKNSGAKSNHNFTTMYAMMMVIA